MKLILGLVVRWQLLNVCMAVVSVEPLLGHSLAISHSASAGLWAVSATNEVILLAVPLKLLAHSGLTKELTHSSGLGCWLEMKGNRLKHERSHKGHCTM